MRILILFPLLALGLWSTPAQADPPIRLHPKNPHYFEFRGKPTVLVSSAEHYGAVINLDFDFVAYLDTLAKDTLNLTRVWVGGYIEDGKSFGISQNTLAPKGDRFLAPWARTAVPGPKGYGKKFDLSTWDPVYWDRLKRYLSEAGKRGVIVEVVLFCAFYNDGQWALSPWNETNNVNGIGKGVSRVDFFRTSDAALNASRDSLVKKLVTELNGFDNITFELANEPYSDQLVPAAFEKHVATLVTATEKMMPNKHLISQNISNGSAKVKDPNPDVSIFNFHYGSPPDAVDLNFGLNRVIADDETGFRGQGDDVYRIEAWNFLMAGGAVFDHLDYSFTTDHPDGTRMPLPTAEPGGGGPTFRRQMKTLRGFFDGMDFVSLAPRLDLKKTDLTGGRGIRILATKSGPVTTLAGYISSAAAKGSDYSVRWTGSLTSDVTGTTIFHTNSNDGIRVWIDGKMIIDDWTNHSERENEGKAEVVAGKAVPIRVEYYQDAGSAIARLGWTRPGKPREIIAAGRLAPVGGKGTGLHAEYFHNRVLTMPAFTRVDQKIDFDWSVASPFAKTAKSPMEKPKLSLDLPTGIWRAEWLDPISGSTKKRETFSHKGGTKHLLLPPMTTDLAVRLTKN